MRKALVLGATSVLVGGLFYFWLWAEGYSLLVGKPRRYGNGR